MKIHLNSRRNKLVLLGLVTILGIALEAFLFSASGPFIRLGNIDLNFLLAPLIILLLLFVFSAVIPLVMVNRYTLLLSTIIQYFGLTMFTYLIFHRALLLSRLPFLTQKLSVLNALSDSALYLALFWVGLGLYSISNLVIPNKRGLHFHRPFLAMLGYLVIGIALWKILNIFSIFWTPLQGLGFVIGLALIIVALTRLTAYFTSTLSFNLDKVIKWTYEHPVRLFWYSILVMCYFVFARPLFYSISEYAYLIEWVVICFVGYQILNTVKNNLKIEKPRILEEDDWKKHQQIVNSIADDDFNKMVTLQEEFIQTGLRRNLLLFLGELLKTNGINENQINALLQPVIEYNDAQARWYYRWFFKNKLVRVNRDRRTRVLTESMNKIRDIIYPTSNLVNGATHA